MAKKTYKKVSDLPTKTVRRGGKDVERVKAPAPEHVNDPAYVELRVCRANARRPEDVE